MAEPKPAKKSDQLLAAIESGQITLAPTNQVRTLGPPEEYFARPGAPPGFRKYVDGDQWAPGGLSYEDRARLQHQMNQVGLFGSKGFRPGVWGPEEAGAWSDVLAFANASFIQDPQEALRLYGARQKVDSPRVQGPREPLTVRYANPESVRQVVRSSAYKMIGRRLSDDEENRIISGFQSQSAASQSAVYAAEPGGGAVTSPMTAEEYATSQIERTQPAELGAQRYVEAFDKILGAFSPMVPTPRSTQGGGIA